MRQIWRVVWRGAVGLIILFILFLIAILVISWISPRVIALAKEMPLLEDSIHIALLVGVTSGIAVVSTHYLVKEILNFFRRRKEVPRAKWWRTLPAVIGCIIALLGGGLLGFVLLVRQFIQ